MSYTLWCFIICDHKTMYPQITYHILSHSLCITPTGACSCDAGVFLQVAKPELYAILRPALSSFVCLFAQRTWSRVVAFG